MLFWAEARIGRSKSPIYAYLFTHPAPGPESARFGAFHSSEIPYVFGTLDKAPAREFGAVDRQISDLMQSYWVNFVKAGNPNGVGMPHRSQLSRDNQILLINQQPMSKKALSGAQLKFFRAYAASGGQLGLF